MKKTFANTSPAAKPTPVQARGIIRNHQEEEKEKAPKRRGRPPKEADPLQAKLTLYFTEAELEVIKDRAGLVPLAKHLRHYLLESGYFK